MGHVESCRVGKCCVRCGAASHIGPAYRCVSSVTVWISCGEVTFMRA